MKEAHHHSILDYVQRVVYGSSVLFIAGLSLWVTIMVAKGPVGIALELGLLRPLSDFSITNVECVNPDDGLAKGVLTKTIYPGGVVAEFKGMTLLKLVDPKDRLPWWPYQGGDKEVQANDRTPANRPGGTQTMEIFIKHGCGTPFTAHTSHLSPVTGNTLNLTWGPFNLPKS